MVVSDSLKHLGMELFIYNMPRLLLLLQWVCPFLLMVSHLQSHLQHCIHFITIIEATVASR